MPNYYRYYKQIIYIPDPCSIRTNHYKPNQNQYKSIKFHIYDIANKLKLVITENLQ